MTAPEMPEVDRFSAWIARYFGLHFESAKFAQLADILQRRTNGAATTDYLTRLEAGGPDRREFCALAPELTVAETYFFRHYDQFRAVLGSALPERFAQRGSHAPISILSAGCASGEEAYTLAILIHEYIEGQELDAQFTIRGVDLNPANIEKARAGRYSRWSLRDLPAEVEQRWFRPSGNEFVLDERIRKMVTFQETNLCADTPELWRPESHDIVFCRNVLMYFTPEQGRGVVGRITRSLAPGGYLFLGHAETLRALSNDYGLCHTHDTFYYQKRAAGHTDGFPLQSWNYDAVGASASPELLTNDWVKSVADASERISALSDNLSRSTSSPVSTPPAKPNKSNATLFSTLELLKTERFSDALVRLDSLSTEAARQPEALLLRAVLLTQSGALELAEQVCRKLLDVDALDAGAHYLLALCREGVGDRQAAIDHNQRAVHLDPSFAMPRFHLGLLSRQAGDLTTARRELGQALTLLQHEDPARVILFGGGFGREGLVALCRSELLRVGGRVE